MEPLVPRASLRDIQDYVAKLEVERGFTKRGMGAQALKLVEEVGEVCRAVDALEGQPQDPQGRVNDLGEEAADTLIMLMSGHQPRGHRPGRSIPPQGRTQ